MISDFIPIRTDARFKKWAENGLVKYSDLYKDGALRHFQDLKVYYGLTKKVFAT